MPFMKIAAAGKKKSAAKDPEVIAKAQAGKQKTLAGGAFAAQEQALEPGGTSDTVAAQEQALKPQAAAKVPFPESTEELTGSAAFKIATVAAWSDAKSFPAPIAALLLQGIAAEGISDATTLEAALKDYVDQGEVTLLSITDAATGATQQWLRFYAGDTEVGYIFSGTALRAIVSDGSIMKR